MLIENRANVHRKGGLRTGDSRTIKGPANVHRCRGSRSGVPWGTLNPLTPASSPLTPASSPLTPASRSRKSVKSREIGVQLLFRQNGLQISPACIRANTKIDQFPKGPPFEMSKFSACGGPNSAQLLLGQKSTFSNSPPCF